MTDDAPAPEARVVAAPASRHACPVCGGPNGCGVAQAGDFAAACWCMDAAPAPGVLEALPPADVDRACLCRRCLTGAVDPA